MIIVQPGPNGYLIGENGEYLKPPKDWSFLPAGDAGITRKVTAKGVSWRVQIRKGKRLISKGIWAPEDHIAQAKAEVLATRQTDEYQKKQVYNAQRREQLQTKYEIEFTEAIASHLNFHERYHPIQKRMAQAISDHATPIGSGTVARTKMIPIRERASHAVIAWMRHQTTAYDNLKIARIKGERRAVRRELAQQSITLLSKYRKGLEVSSDCPLYRAIKKIKNSNG